jgi:hypothetical protein
LAAPLAGELRKITNFRAWGQQAIRNIHLQFNDYRSYLQQFSSI